MIWPFKKKPAIQYSIVENGDGQFRAYYHDKGVKYITSLFWRDSLKDAEKDIESHIKRKEKEKMTIVAQYYI